MFWPVLEIMDLTANMLSNLLLLKNMFASLVRGRTLKILGLHGNTGLMSSSEYAGEDETLPG